ncbi:hypothetical protein ACFUCH_08100 [Streptomyces olivaceus]|uniref:hypothetical protein n=1 Tax=Streptomyces olivaceus TaxID=47716 RepID=UPI00364498CC
MKDLNDALHALHKRAGYPAARKLREMIGKEVFSHTKIHDALTKPLLPTRGVVELVVRELAKMARPPIGDIEAEVNRLTELWHAAHGDAPEAAPENVSDRPEGPVGDPFDDPFEDMDGNADAREAAPRNPSGRAETPNADLFDQFFRGEGAESQPKTPEDLANEVIKAAYKAH